MDSKPNRAGIGCLMIGAILWWVFLLGFDGLIAWTLVHQGGASRSYVAVDAVVTGSYVQRTNSSGTGPRASGSIDYKPVIQYEFEVNGQQYVGDRYSFVVWGRGNPDYAQSLVNQYPPGRAITAYYDPSDPNESVIDQSFDEFPTVIALLLLPFHCVGAILVFIFRHMWRYRDLEGDARWIAPYRAVSKVSYSTGNEEDRSEFKDFTYPGWLVFTTTLCVSSFVMTWVHLVASRGFNSSYLSVSLTLLACLLVSALNTARKIRSYSDPGRRLIIDRKGGRVSRGDQGVEIERIGSVGVETTTKMKNNREGWCTLTARARLADGSWFDLLVCKGHRDHARVLKRVMKKELGL